MRFRYEYRTSDNVPHEDVVVARNRDAVFTLLAKRHIKPSRVEELPDPWRWWKRLGLFMVGVSVVAGAVWFAGYRTSIVKPESRRQIYGDPVLIENGVAGDWAAVIENPVDRYLARYAQPGWKVRVVADDAQRAAVARQLREMTMPKLRYADEDVAEHRQLKRIVAGLREEAVAFVTAGGTAEEYLKLLDVRQVREHELHAKAVENFRTATASASQERIYELWMSSNRKLRSMGLRTIAIPESLAEWQ